jgi:hypothetical protein
MYTASEVIMKYLTLKELVQIYLKKYPRQESSPMLIIEACEGYFRTEAGWIKAC